MVFCPTRSSKSEFWNQRVHEEHSSLANFLHLHAHFLKFSVLELKSSTLEGVRTVLDFNFRIPTIEKHAIVFLAARYQCIGHFIGTKNFGAQVVVGNERQSIEHCRKDWKSLGRNR